MAWRTRYTEHVHPLRVDSKYLTSILNPKQADLVYVDGAHDAASTVRDIREAQWLVASGGLVCGDDYDVRPERLSSYSEADLLKDNARGSHPGVTHALVKTFGQWQAFNRLWWMQL